jgi:hypothetical protein
MGHNDPTVDILRFPDGTTVRVGAGDPEGAVTAPPGSLYLRGTGRIYRKDTGTGTTGWVDTYAAPSTPITLPLALASGGTHADLSATGGAGQVLKQSGAGANVSVATLALADLPVAFPLSLANGGTHADLSATGGTGYVLQQASVGANVTVGPISMASLGAMPSPATRNVSWLTFQPTNVAPISVGGFGTVSAAGTLADGGLSRTGTKYSTSTNAIVLGIMGSSQSQFMSKYNPRLTVLLNTGASIANCRFLIGFAFGSSWDADNLAASHCGIRFSTSAGDASWVGIVRGDSGAQAVTASLGAIAINTDYTLVVDITGNGTLASFSVNGAAPVTIATNLPTPGTIMNWNVHKTNLATEAKTLILMRCYGEWD